MLPPPAITTRRTGLSSLRSSPSRARMSSRAARKNTSSSSSMTVSPSGVIAAAGAVDRDDARVGVRQMLAQLAQRAGRRAARRLRARTPTSRTRPSAKSSTCSAPGYWISCSMYSVTSCSGLIEHIDRRSASSPEQLAAAWCTRRERMRAIFVGVRNSVYAIWHAIMFTSSLLVSATMMSASRAPAASSTSGCDALPATVRMSSRSCRSRSTSSFDVDDGDFVRFFARRGDTPPCGRPGRRRG